MEDRHQRRDHDPKPGPFSCLPPGGLVHVGRLRADVLGQLAHDRVQGSGRLLLQLADAAGRQRYAQQLSTQLLGLTLAQPVGPGQQRQRCLQTRAGLAPGHAHRQTAAGGGAAARAAQTVQPVLGDQGTDDGQFQYLVPQRLRVVALQRLPATATGVGADFQGMVGQQRRPLLGRLAGLAAALLAGGGPGRAAFDGRGVAGGRAGGVA